jgi:hypothetical protein
MEKSTPPPPARDGAGAGIADINEVDSLFPRKPLLLARHSSATKLPDLVIDCSDIKRNEKNQIVSNYLNKCYYCILILCYSR